MRNIFDIFKNHMKNVFRIYKRDMKNILTSYVTLAIIIALSILPSLYSWFNIKACWDPYANTKGLSVAVVNLDKGTEFRNVKINVGDDVIKKLANNQAIGWKFVSESEAENGVKYGKYYASVTIPKDFSQNLLSIVIQDTPKKSELVYSVNEKRNAIAPKITQKGATNLQEEITRNFIQTSSDTILSYLNQFGIELDKIKPGLKNIVDVIVNVDNSIPQVGKDLDNFYSQSVEFQKYMQNVQKNLPVTSDALNKTLGIAQTGNGYISKTQQSLQAISPSIKSNLSLVKDTADNAETLLKGLQDLKTSDTGANRKVLVTVRDKYADGVKKLDNILSLLNSINNVLNNGVLENFINNLSNVRNQMSDQQNFLNLLINTIDQGNQVLPENINSAVQGAGKISGALGNIIDNFDTQIAPVVDQSLKNFAGLSDDSVKILQNMQTNMPLVSSLIGGINTASGSSVDRLKELKDKFPKIQQDIHSNAEKLKGLSDDQKFNEITKLLKKDAKKESDFLANPIDLKQNRVYPIPNYGSAMSPFYTTLSLWVGAFILLSLLSVEVKSFEDGVKLGAREQFFGRYFTFVTIAIMQALVTTIGNLILLKTYVVSPIIYVMLGVYTSIVFTMIIYTLVSVLRNIGKALAMVAMVLQVSASGGTFPIELMPQFFQNINPMMPFTYAIGAMRETVGGILMQALVKNILILSIFFFISVFFGVFFKEKANKLSEKFVKQFKESGLAGE
ncbi:YhgE/Pip domain-containing protein [Clostridium sp. P21]|uniref:YhgE/Pip domain-containing protein n=1 Tax=Clostridium muellerianum TaxID=2716538 RepID=A0A7Y0HMM3_9CLOT|nr:YhgE/Pip domain-containing protein [Clostridium muellerianum]NMM62325.1 YhgE/Pip domain-containing protein [Clostridium muellerianum]